MISKMDNIIHMFYFVLYFKYLLTFNTK